MSKNWFIVGYIIQLISNNKIMIISMSNYEFICSRLDDIIVVVFIIR